MHTLLNTATVAARDVNLTGAEARVLEELVINAGKPVTRDRQRFLLYAGWRHKSRDLVTQYVDSVGTGTANRCREN